MKAPLFFCLQSMGDKIHARQAALACSVTVVSIGLSNVYCRLLSICLQSMGDKIQARQAAIACGVAVVPGTDGAIASAEEAREFTNKVG